MQSELTTTQLSDLHGALKTQAYEHATFNSILIDAITDLTCTLRSNAPGDAPKDSSSHGVSPMNSSSQPKYRLSALVATRTTNHTLDEDDGVKEWKEAGSQLLRMSVYIHLLYTIFCLTQTF
jgi:hypothetical protein